ncbi:MAG: sigma-70 family RNA polymerase sigma factor [Chitinophagaceae bacterium]
MKTNQWLCMAGGDRNAFLTIYHNHYHALFCYGFSITTDKELTKDCIQELFLDIWKTRDTLNKEVSNVRSYLFTWLRRKITSALSGLAKAKSLVSKQDATLTQSCYEELLITFQRSEEKKEQLREALTKLTKKQLEIVRLKFFEKLTYAEIAAKTSLAPRTVYNLIYEAIRHLRGDMIELALLNNS